LITVKREISVRTIKHLNTNGIFFIQPDLSIEKTVIQQGIAWPATVM
jgi:hypothetical protein